MKVLVINAESGFGGGPAVIANDIAKTVIKQGGEAMVAYGRQADPNSGVTTFYIKNGIALYTHVLLTRLFDAHGLGSRNATKHLIRFIEEYNPDVVNLHNIHGYYLNIEILFRYLAERDIPIVWTLHDCWAFTGHCAYFDKVDCKKWESGCSACPIRSSYPKSIIDRSARNYAIKKELFTKPHRMKIVTPSKWLEAYVKSSFLSKYECITIHNGIDLKKYRPLVSNWKSEHGLAKKKIVLGVAAGWDERKGLGDMFELSKVLGDKYAVVIVGLRPEQMKTIPEGVIGILRTESVEELIRIYTTADVFVNPTVSDNFPTVNLEALACGTPVVTYNTGGSGEALDAECGVIVEQRNVRQMADSVRELCLKANLEEKCLRRIVAFDAEKQYDKYVDVFSSMSGVNNV